MFTGKSFKYVFFRYLINTEYFTINNLLTHRSCTPGTRTFIADLSRVNVSLGETCFMSQ